MLQDARGHGDHDLTLEGRLGLVFPYRPGRWDEQFWQGKGAIMQAQPCAQALRRFLIKPTQQSIDNLPATKKQKLLLNLNASLASNAASAIISIHTLLLCSAPHTHSLRCVPGCSIALAFITYYYRKPQPTHPV